MTSPGLEISRRFHDEVVRPALSARFGALRYAAGRLGTGSEVLGLDDDMSRDHDWGLRLDLLVDAPAVPDVAAHLDDALPETFAGLPVRFPMTWDPTARHRVSVTDPDAFVAGRVGRGVGDWSADDWFAVSGQAVLEVVAGPVFADTDGRLTAARRHLAWYPDDVWRHLVASDWQRLAQELPLMGRAGHRGDDLGSRVLAARLVGVAMHLGFLLERRWAPYSKWFGVLHARLPHAPRVLPDLTACLAAEAWEPRQEALGRALRTLGEVQRGVGLPAVEPVPFHDRPFLGIDEDLPGRMVADVEDPPVRGRPPGVGSITQVTDNVDVLVSAGRRSAVVRALTGYERAAADDNGS